MAKSDAYPLLSWMGKARRSVREGKDRLASRIPPSMRMSRVSSYEKTMFAAAFLFWGTVTYLGRFIVNLESYT